MAKITQLNKDDAQTPEIQIIISKFPNGLMRVESIPPLAPPILKAVLSETLSELTEDIAVNRALTMLAEYIENKEKQIQVVKSIKGH